MKEMQAQVTPLLDLYEAVGKHFRRLKRNNDLNAQHDAVKAYRRVFRARQRAKVAKPEERL